MHASHRTAMPMASAISSFSRTDSAPSPMSLWNIVPKARVTSGAAVVMAATRSGHSR